MQSFSLTMQDILPLLPLDTVVKGRSVDLPCPACNDTKKHLNINLEKNVFHCNRCGEHGGVLSLYCLYYPQSMKSAFHEIQRQLQGETIHRKMAVPGKAVAKKYVPQSLLADISVRNKTYRALLALLHLSSDHKKDLLHRGLSCQMIEENLYRTVPMAGQAMLCQKLLEQGCTLAGVPGFYQAKSGHWMFVSPSRGFLIPVLDMAGCIQGLTVRLDQSHKGKYRWVSSYDYQSGVKAYGWVHIAGPLQTQILLTEGHLKGEIVHRLTGQTVVAVPGVNNLTELKRLLPALYKQGVRRVMTAYDMDFLRKEPVKHAYHQLCALLEQNGVSYGAYFWPPKYNGLDDYCLASQKGTIRFY